MMKLVNVGMIAALGACAFDPQPSADLPTADGLSGSVLDERDDAIDFSTGAPIHTHQGEPTELGAGCPAVYKYAYLEHRTAPEFGAEASPNPLAWHVASGAATTYRVRLDNGRLARDWTPVEAPDVVQLDRDAVPALADYTGRMYLDVMSSDGAIDIACWENHPLAAPLEVEPAAHGELFGWTLAAHSPISTAIVPGGPGEGAGVYSQTFVQHVAEPVRLHFAHSAISGMAMTTVLTESVATEELHDTIACDAPGGCTVASAPAPASKTSTVAPLAATFELRLVDAATGETIWRGSDALDAVIPARAAGELPRAYTAVIAMNNSSLDPAPGYAIAEQLLVDAYVARIFTGAVIATSTPCVQTSGTMCVAEQTVATIAVLDDASIAFAPLSTSVETAVDASAALEPIGAYAPRAYFTLNSAVWDAGNGGF